MNSLFIEGKLGKDAALKVVPSGKSVLEFSVAVTESYKKDNAWHKHTEWFDCALWGNQANSKADYMKKGTPVVVSGKLRTQEWENKEGEKRSKKYVLANYVNHFSKDFPNKSKIESGANDGFSANTKPVNNNSFTSDDIPF